MPKMVHLHLSTNFNLLACLTSGRATFNISNLQRNLATAYFGIMSYSSIQAALIDIAIPAAVALGTGLITYALTGGEEEFPSTVSNFRIVYKYSDLLV